MQFTFRVASTALASACAIVALAALHEACGGTLTSDTADSGGKDGSKRPDSRLPDTSSGETLTGDAVIIDGGAGEAGVDSGGCATLAGKLARWAKMEETPFSPWHYAGLDLGSTEAGITLDQAELINCAGDPSDGAPGIFAPVKASDGGTCDPCGRCYAGITWGTKQEVNFTYDTTSRVVAFLSLNAGYTGPLTIKGAAGTPLAGHTYLIQVGSPIAKDGIPFKLDWTDPSVKTLMEIYNAAMATFVPGYTYDSLPCTATSVCYLLNANFDGHYYFGIRELALYLQFDVGGSTPTRVYTTGAGYVVKYQTDDAGAYLQDDAGNLVIACDGGVAD